MLNRHLPQAAEGDANATHQARVASRRLREAVPVLAARLKGSRSGKAARKIRRLTRSLGSVRELDVTLGLAEQLAGNNRLPRAAVEDVRAQLTSQRTRLRETMVDELERVDVDKLNRRLTAVTNAIAEAPDAPWRERLAARLLRRTRALSTAMDTAGQMYSPEQLHQVRIASKKLRYALELAAATRTAGAAGLVRTLKRTQDMLGSLHDLQVLARIVTSVQAAPPRGAAATPRDLTRLANHIEQECRQLHGRYVASIASLRRVCAAVSSDIVPALAHPKSRRRGIKMTLPRTAARAAGSRR